ncbi:uncharacterized protein I303_107770 [Kwoniella dejecticola CBS 10117]|uniref:Zn(2)-C6 fungal-type domain-containing protein n=1 Tax=Kwoniella dejecticola CBS 10117 TaxID=1296121 RepID=A0A1A5ZVN6_9TREE|nr:uncharacterized protein I303_07775 [Kwoniella dejecticola CBS 10117]OBR81865.1 hypothetical protein I303_07775 [Kwoniella dejecticola CBS 10117]
MAPTTTTPRPDQRRRSSSVTAAPGTAAPAQNRVACKRCFVRKRKCDKLQPRCTACVEADVECEPGVKGVERSLLLQTQELQRRVEWLEGIIRHNQPSLQTISSLSTGTDVPASFNQSYLPSQPSGEFNLSSLVTAGLSMQRAEHMPDQGYVEIFSSPLPRPTDLAPSIRSARDHPRLPTYERSINIISSWLSRHLQSHHCVTKEGIEEDIKLVYGPDGLVDKALAGSRFRCFSIIYLEMSPAYHGGDTAYEQEFGLVCKSLALREITHVVAKEDLTAVQALCLLCIYGVDIPGGPSLSQLVGFAARAAMAINLHRRDDVYFNPLLASEEEKNNFEKHNELRKNIFWAIYCLDRLAAFTLGQPMSVRDSDVDVDLLSNPVASNMNDTVEVSGIALRCHQIHLRRLYGIARETFYSASVNPNRTIEEKEAIVADFVRQAQAWYSQSPLKAAFVPMTEATISRQVVDDISYHQMIMAAHRPSPLIPEIPSSFINTLKYSATLSIDLYRHYVKSKKVLIIWTHLYQIFISCTTLVFCFSEYKSRSDLMGLDEKEIEIRIEQCKDLLGKFANHWPESSRYQIMFDNLVTSFRAQYQPGSHIDSTVHPTEIEGQDGLAHQRNIDFWNTLNNYQIPILAEQSAQQQVDTEPQEQEIQQTFTGTGIEDRVSPPAEDTSHLGGVDQPEVSIFDLFGNFPMLDPASENNDGLHSGNAQSNEQIFNSMGPPWEYSPGSLGSMNSVMGI